MDAYLLLAASLVPLVGGPLIARWAERSTTTTVTLDAFVAVTVGGISLLHVLPHAYAVAGVTALVAMAIGFVLPLGLGHHHGGEIGSRRPVVILIAFLGLGVHATLDGLALFGPRVEVAAVTDGGSAGNDHGPAPGVEGSDHDRDQHHANASLLATAVILHRLPMALAIWWIATPALGRRIALGLLTLIGGATLAGFALGGWIWGVLSSPGLAILQAVIAGMLLHMVLGHHEHATDEPLARSSRLISTVGVVAGIALLVAMTRIHPFERPFPGELSAEAAFRALALTAAPAVLWAYVGIALVHGLAPSGIRSWWLGWARETLGAPAGRSATATGAALVLRPEIQLPVLALSFALLGPTFMTWRLLAVLAIASLAVLSVKSLLDAPTPSAGDDRETASTVVRPGLVEGVRFAFGTVFDRTLPWILLGLGVASLLEPTTDFASLLALPQPARIGVLAFLGMPLYLLGLGATPIVAVLAHKGFGLGALAAFLLAGVAVSGARRLRTAFGGRVAWSFAVRMLVLALVAAYVLDAPIRAPELHELAGRDPGWLAWLSALVLLALTLASLYRQGLRRFLRPSAAMERWHGAGL